MELARYYVYAEFFGTSLSPNSGNITLYSYEDGALSVFYDTIKLDPEPSSMDQYAEGDLQRSRSNLKRALPKLQERIEQGLLLRDSAKRHSPASHLKRNFFGKQCDVYIRDKRVYGKKSKFPHEVCVWKNIPIYTTRSSVKADRTEVPVKYVPLAVYEGPVDERLFDFSDAEGLSDLVKDMIDAARD